MLQHSMRGRSLLLAALLSGALALPAAAHAAPSPACAARLVAVAYSAADKEKAISGWPGAPAQYLGRYHLTGSSDPALATGGELTVFLRKVPPLPRPQLSGILSLTAKDQTNVIYLTKFMHAGARLWTSVHLGIYTGPVLGQFKVTSIHGGRLAGQLVPQGKKPIDLQFLRFSTNPHP